MTRETRRCGRCGKLGRLRSPERQNRCRECERLSSAKAELNNLLSRGNPVDFLIDKKTIDYLGIDITHPYMQRTVFQGGRIGIFGENLTQPFRNMAQGHGYMTRVLPEGETRIDAINNVAYRQDIDRPLFVAYPGLAIAPSLDALTQLGGTVFVIAEGDQARRWEKRAPKVMAISPNELPIRDWR